MSSSPGTTLCSGAVDTFTATILNGGTAPFYQWKVNGVNVGSDASTYRYAPAGGDVVTVSLISSAVCASPDTVSATQTITTVTSPVVGGITGDSSVITGASITLYDGAAGGSWSSNNTAVATVGSAGVVTGVSAGTAIISYSISNICGIATVSKTVIVNNPGISGPGTLCVGTSSTLTEGIYGGTWLSSNTSVVTIGSISGVVTGVSAGTAIISYFVSGTITTHVITVLNAPTAIVGLSAMCANSTITLTDAVTGYAWSSGNNAVGTVSVSGTVTGISAGTTIITYGGSGCFVTKTITVNPAPSAVTGPSILCTGTVAQFTDITSGGVWSSSNTSTAAIGSLTGIVTSITATGTATISYSISGCSSFKTVSVCAPPSAISGNANLCAGAAATLSDATGGGVWSCANISVATVGSTGLVTGVSSGTTLVSYTIASGCASMKSVSVAVSPGAITGPAIQCAGVSTQFSDITSGGVWSSSNTSAAIVSTAGVVTGEAPGSMATITYTITGCISTKAVSVYATPVAPSGVANLCAGSSATYTDATSGGAWSSSNTSVAVFGTGAVITGVATGTTIVSYSLSSGCAVTKVLTVNLSPVPVSGVTSLCTGYSATFTDGISGGLWTSSNALVATVGSAGMVTGISVGTANITYTIDGCGRFQNIGIHASPGPIGGASNGCTATPVTLTDAAPGGAWSSSNTSVAVIGSLSGVMNGVSLGVTTITYTLPSGCSVTRLVAVDASPAAVFGPSQQCTGDSTLFICPTPGGIWTSSNTSAATVGSLSGIVNGIATGIAGLYGVATISYTLSTGCYSEMTVSVYAAPYPITGYTNQCTGVSTTMYDVTTGGTWTSTNTTVAGVSIAAGVVTGVSAGTTSISYTVPNGCAITTLVHVNPTPDIVNGPSHICTGVGYPFTDATPGGAWSCSNLSAATVGTSGTVTGVTGSSVANITYTIATGCLSLKTISVNTSPIAIAGVGSVVAGSTTTFADATTGGTWASGNSSVATVGTSGHVTGVAAGSTVISYTLVSGCSVSHSITVTRATGREGGSMASGDEEAPWTIQLIPNPNTGSFNIKGSTGSEQDETLQLQVTDMLGRQVYTASATATNGFLDVPVQLKNTLANGMYVLSIQTSRETASFHFLVTR